MKKEIVAKKIGIVNEWVVSFREKKDWANYRLAVEEYNRLLGILKTCE